ncbi:hypothetical protein HPB51_015617 [Rhipicephalus microplus]|uniref:THAP-type domain-containing protein n=1 Tax=Rhipicephalus microplus TaxID=6941 RepID=A0A9J6DH22_RHIMP|nr:hypothetical protein HPB51_015617 [Rhipicephalus microplus]
MNATGACGTTERAAGLPGFFLEERAIEEDIMNAEVSVKSRNATEGAAPEARQAGPIKKAYSVGLKVAFVSFAARCFHYVGPLHDSGALRFTVSDSPRSCPAFEFPYGFGESSDYPRRVRDGKSKSPGDSLQSSGECAAAVGVSFHRFPKDAMIYKKWIVAIKRDEGPEFQVGKSTKVCSKHFRSSDFIPSVASGRSLLRDSAVPSVFAFSKEKKERKPPKPRASPQVRSQNPVLGPGVLGDELMHSPDEVKAAPVGLEEPTRLNSSLEGENARLAETIKQKNNEIARLRDELCQIKEQLVAAKGIIGQLGFEKASLTCQLAAERERTAPFTMERFKDCDEDMLFYTGLPSYNHFKKLLVYLNPGDDGCNVLRSERTESSEPRSSRGRKRKLSTENELFLVLVRLRLGLFEDDLAHRFCIAQSTVSRICTSWINFLYAKLGLLPLWAPRRVVDATMPPEFKEKYSSTRVILDATEIQCEVPSSLCLQSTTYSPYKSSNTFKGLIGVLPNGLVAFVSELFTGSSSDRDSMAEDVVVSSHDMLLVTTD